MKKILFIILCLGSFSFADIVLAENIVGFNSDITINSDATVDVVESIVYDFGNEYRHGIYRDIPIKYTTNSGNKYVADIDNVSVVDEKGGIIQFTLMREGNNKRIKIGDPNRTIKGKHKYKISYTVHDAITYFDDHDEFYWNITGDKWPVGMDVVTVRVRANTISKATCFVGTFGSNKHCDLISNIDNNKTVTFAQKQLKPYNGMTIVIGMPAGTVYKPTTWENVFKIVKENWIIVMPIVVLIFMWRRWLKYGKDPKGRGTIVPYYEAPDDLSPAEVGMIIDEKVHTRDVSALFINLAINERLHIRKNRGSYKFIKTDNTSYVLKDEEKLLFESIFTGTKKEVSVSSLKDSFYTDLERIKQYVVDNVITKGYYAKNPKNVKGMYMIIGIIMFISFPIVGSIFGSVAGLAVFLSIFPVIGFGFWMPRRTKKGVITREKILGLKLYMETAEKDRINFHNAPEKNPETFEKLLPYAMALGVEKKWAKQFEDIYDGKPDWYEGDGAFRPSLLANDLKSFSRSTESAMTSRPSSASSGGSGFSGGGSGGGFGGGGGGSW